MNNKHSREPTGAQAPPLHERLRIIREQCGFGGPRQMSAFARKLGIAPASLHELESGNAQRLGGKSLAGYMRAGASLQVHRLAPGTYDHVAALLHYMAPPPGARVLDVGCGVGAVAVAMLEQRPDLRLVLMNLSAWQLAQCPSALPRVRADMHALPFAPAAFDVVMCNYVLGHGVLHRVLPEVVRVLPPHAGKVFIYDLTSDDGNGLLHINYRAHAMQRVCAEAAAAGLVGADLLQWPGVDVSHLLPLVPQSEALACFAAARPVLYVFERRT
jgi:SAM-dependent methyltransferase